jgi:hypothetical protein
MFPLGVREKKEKLSVGIRTPDREHKLGDEIKIII